MRPADMVVTSPRKTLFLPPPTEQFRPSPVSIQPRLTSIDDDDPKHDFSPQAERHITAFLKSRHPHSFSSSHPPTLVDNTSHLKPPPPPPKTAKPPRSHYPQCLPPPRPRPHPQPKTSSTPRSLSRRDSPKATKEWVSRSISTFTLPPKLPWNDPSPSRPSLSESWDKCPIC